MFQEFITFIYIPNNWHSQGNGWKNWGPPFPMTNPMGVIRIRRDWCFIWWWMIQSLVVWTWSDPEKTICIISKCGTFMVDDLEKVDSFPLTRLSHRCIAVVDSFIFLEVNQGCRFGPWIKAPGPLVGISNIYRSFRGLYKPSVDCGFFPDKCIFWGQICNLVNHQKCQICRTFHTWPKPSQVISWWFDKWIEFIHLEDKLPRWWFQPIWKICSSNWKSSPNRGENFKKKWNHQPDSCCCWWPSMKLTYPLKIGHPERKIIFQPSIFRGYVSFRECNCCCWWLPSMKLTNIPLKLMVGSWFISLWVSPNSCPVAVKKQRYIHRRTSRSRFEMSPTSTELIRFQLAIHLRETYTS